MKNETIEIVNNIEIITFLGLIVLISELLKILLSMKLLSF